MEAPPKSNDRRDNLQPASCRFLAIFLLSRTDVWERGDEQWGVSGWLVNGMQEARGSNPLSSTTGHKPYPASPAPASVAPRSRYAAIRSAPGPLGSVAMNGRPGIPVGVQLRQLPGV